MNNLMEQIIQRQFKFYADYGSTIEMWAVIDGYDNYQVSTFGRVKNSKYKRIIKARLDTNEYYIVDLHKNNKRQTMRVHRLVSITFINNLSNKLCVDHIDRNPKNNNISNLRWATNSENNMNRTVQTNNTSGITGVYQHKNSQKWCAVIKIDGIRKNLGIFASIEAAKKARVNAVNRLFKEFAPK